MGRPYSTELSQLETTYAWAHKADVAPLADAISVSSSLPALVVGSGGSLSAAHHAAAVHTLESGIASRAITPLEIVRSSIYLGDVGTLFLSAGGTNADIIGSFRNVVEREPRSATVLCFKPGSQLSQLAHEYKFVHVIEMTPPVAKDGFLSTNSLLAFMVLVERAYSAAFGKRESLPASLHELMPGDGFLDQLARTCAPVWSRATTLLLHGIDVSAAAIDFESKFSEAALGNVQIADLRNFAHGRHNWIATRPESTGVCALYSDDDRDLAEATLKLLPKGLPIARIHLPMTGPAARVAALVAVLHAVGQAGKAREIDPGRPHVPEFGRKIYHLNAFPKTKARSTTEDVAIARKLRMDLSRVPSATSAPWRRAYRDFTSRMGSTSFGAVLFDYDGTLCDGRDRFSGLRKEVSAGLKQLVAAGVRVGIATGRGKSVRESLREALPENAWHSVLIGYYNCTDVGLLNDDSHPNLGTPPLAVLAAIETAIKQHPILSSSAIAELRPTQLTVQPKAAAEADLVWRAGLDLVQAYREAKIVRSTHSFDVIPAAASKCALLRALDELVAPKGVLCIGDMGRWPGNDRDMLATPFSLSVDETSLDPESCWNLAPTGHKGVQATLDYMKAFECKKGTLTFAPDNVTTRRERE